MLEQQRNITFEKRDSPCYEKWGSSGAHGDSFDFYTSQYASNYCSKPRKIQPSKCTPCTNGFISNERPFMRYSRSLDAVDNPQMGDECLENYQSVTHRDFALYRGSDSWGALPRDYSRIPSSFVKNTFYEQPGVLFPTKSVTAEFLETGRVGRKYEASDPRHKPPTGITSNCPPRDTISGSSLKAYVDGYPGWMIDKPTGLSITKTDFLPYTLEPKLNQKLFPKIIKNPNPDSNRTAEMVSDPAEILKDLKSRNVHKREPIIPKKDPIDSWDRKEPFKRSVYTCSYKKPILGDQRRPDEVNIGPQNKELGKLRSSQLYQWKPDNPCRFITDYVSGYWQRHPLMTDPPFPYLRNEFCRVDADFKNMY